MRQPQKLVHSDTLCIRTNKDCSATLLCISFIYLLKMDTEGLNINDDNKAFI